MEDAALPSRSGHCLRGAHLRCSHLAGLEPVGLWRPRPRSGWTHVVCVCDCHADCPLSGRRAVARAVWSEQCTCPGAAAARAQEQREDERRREMSAVHAEARRDGQRDAATIERRLRAVFEEHGEDPPSGLTTASRISAAVNARGGTRTARLLRMGARSAASAIRWAWQQPPGDPAADDRAQARETFRASGPSRRPPRC